MRPDTEEDVTDDERDVEGVASSRAGESQAEGSVSDSAHEEALPELPTPTIQLGTHAFRSELDSLDAVNIFEVWKITGNLMKSVPKFLQGVYTVATRQALDALSLGEERGDVLLQTRAWMLFFLISRVFLFRPS